MKVYREEFIRNTGVRGDRVLFATNRKELELIFGILKKAYQYFPCCPATVVEHDRLSNIRKAIEKYLREDKARGD